MISAFGDNPGDVLTSCCAPVDMRRTAQSFPTNDQCTKDL